jgi:hypothetical protein
MRVLICHRPGGAFGFISDSWINAMSMVPSIQVKRWDGKQGSWDNFRPDLYMGCSGHRQPIPAKSRRNSCKVVIHVNPYGPIKVQPNINEPQEAINWVKKQDPDAVFGYGLEKDRKYWSYWDRDNIPWIPMACAGDATLFNPHSGSHDKDIVYLGGRWDYKAKSIDPYLLPVLRDRSLSHIVCGWGKWPSDLAVSQAPDSQVPSILSSAKIGPCIAEPHSIRYGIDIPERVFKVALSGTIAIHDPVANLSDALESVPVASSPDDYHEKIKSLALSKPGTIATRARKQYNEVFGKHTYHHRLSGMFMSLGLNNESRAIMNSLKILKVDF